MHMDCITLLSKKVKSGDTDNIEGYAAKKYFGKLFSEDFIRRDDAVINSMLNYGYAVVRACIAKYIAIYGLEPSIGLFHHSELNNFNLADDLIEPFRPIVDLYVSQYNLAEATELTKKMKAGLIQLLNVDVSIDEKKQSVNYAIEQVVQSLIRTYKSEADELILPNLLPIKVHSYE